MISTTIDFSPESQAKKIIMKEFESKKWKPFKNWLYENLKLAELKDIGESFYKNCEREIRMLFFVPWFVSTYVESYISVLERNYKLSTQKILTQILPPQQSFQIEKNEKIHNFLAFAKLLEDDTLLTICQQTNILIEQNNYINLYLNDTGE